LLTKASFVAKRRVKAMMLGSIAVVAEGAYVLLLRRAATTEFCLTFGFCEAAEGGLDE